MQRSVNVTTSLSAVLSDMKNIAGMGGMVRAMCLHCCSKNCALFNDGKRTRINRLRQLPIDM